MKKLELIHQFVREICLLAIFAAYLSACNGSPRAQFEYYDDPENHFKLQWQGQSAFNFYTAALSWPVDPQAQKYEVRKIVGNEAIPIQPDGSGVAHIPSLTSGSTYEFQLWRLKDGTWGQIKKIVAQAPRDASIRGTMTYSTFLKTLEGSVNRIFFEPGAVLVTEGAPVDLHIQEIYAANGKIISFPDGQYAGMDHPGRSAGHVNISVEKLHGRLAIEMRGEGGGGGLDGTTIFVAHSEQELVAFGTSICRSEVWGRPGGDGGTLNFHVADLSSDGTLDLSTLGGLGGKPGAGGIHYINTNFYNGCLLPGDETHPPVHSAYGPPGLTGAPGVIETNWIVHSNTAP